jgi:hypothetical protein
MAASHEHASLVECLTPRRLCKSKGGWLAYHPEPQTNIWMMHGANSHTPFDGGTWIHKTSSATWYAPAKGRDGTFAYEDGAMTDTAYLSGRPMKWVCPGGIVSRHVRQRPMANRRRCRGRQHS